MQKRVIVISLGGSLIAPDKIDIKFLKKFRKIIKKNSQKYKFIIVCGGGSIARRYIQALKEDNKSEYLQNLAGIAITRVNARFMSYFFGKDPEFGIPHDMKHIANLLEKNDIIFCGALRYAPNQTSDATSARLAHYFGTDFINLTNVKGLYSSNPFKNKDAKFIPKITREKLYKMILKFKFKPGQHAPVDQTAISIILENKIKTYMLGKNLKNLDNLLNQKKFIGTIVE